MIVELREKVGAAVRGAVAICCGAAAPSDPRELAREGLLELGYSVRARPTRCCARPPARAPRS